MRRPAGVRLVVIVSGLGVAIATGACGKKGPPLPPLNRVPVAPADFVADRKADAVDIHFTIPSANTDGSRPANIQRVEVYGYTGPTAITDDQIWRRGTKLASLEVKAPRDPDDTIEPDDPAADLEPLGGPGLDQGASADVHEDLSAMTGRSSTEPGSRMYIAVGIATNGRKGLLSRRAQVALIAAPPAPAAPAVTYSETAVALRWQPVTSPPGSDPVTGYHVYDVSPPRSTENAAPNRDSAAAPSSRPQGARLTEKPVTDTRLDDAAMEWGVERCYLVRAVMTVDGGAIESAPSPQACVVLKDTFPPAPPKGLSLLPSSSGTSMQLIWDSGTESDLAGYIVLRGVAPAETLTPVTREPVPEPSFTDSVQPGVRYVYAIQAVDKSGNRSEPSERREETAR